jgi:hypothetical protein
MAFLEDPANRDRARHLLIAKYFRPSEQIALYEMSGLPIPGRQEIDRSAAFEPSEKAQVAGQDARFRIKVVIAHNYIRALNAYGLAAVNADRVVGVPEA